MRMIEAPTFSVIIPTYNRPAQIAVCLTALGRLAYPRDLFEVIVVDDGSPVPVEGVVAAHRGTLDVTVIRQENAGPAAARNRGALHAKGTYLAFIDDDCRPKADWLTAFARQFAATPDRLLGGRTINALTDNPYAAASQSIVDLVYRHYNRDPDRARFFSSNNMALPATRFHGAGRFNPRFRTSEDRELCDRWLFAGRQMTYVPEAVVYHAHDLTFKGFCRQHFSYGQGAHHFHRIRATRKSGTMLAETAFHLKIHRWLFFPFTHRKGWQCVPLTLLMILWQVMNAFGFFWEAAGTRTRGHVAWDAPLRRINDTPQTSLSERMNGKIPAGTSKNTARTVL